MISAVRSVPPGRTEWRPREDPGGGRRLAPRWIRAHFRSLPAATAELRKAQELWRRGRSVEDPLTLHESLRLQWPACHGGGILFGHLRGGPATNTPPP